MNKSLDGAFCAHRALIPDTEDSIDFVLALISQELSTKVMCDSSARNALSTKSLKDWYKKKPLPENQYPLEKSVLWECVENGGTDLNCIRTKRAEGWLRKKEKSKNNLQNKQGAEISIEDAKEFIKKGLFHEIKNCSPPSIKRSEKFAELFYTKSKDCEKACNELARLFCISNDESDVRRGFNVGLFLTLGSVLQVKVRNNDNEYWLCLQPPCDSVRLEGKTEMLFLQLYKGNKENSDLIIKLHDESYQPLCVKPPKKKARLKTHGFAPNNTTRRVSVNNLAGKHNGKFKWVAQLRPEKAHAIAQKVLANASRTGLDEFEILRRKGSQF